MKVPPKIKLGFPYDFLYEVKCIDKDMELQIKPKLITKILNNLQKVRGKNEI